MGPVAISGSAGTARYKWRLLATGISNCVPCLLERGVDPLDSRRPELADRKVRIAEAKSAGDEYEALSKRWLREWLQTKSATNRKQIASRRERFVWPTTGAKSLNVVRPAAVLGIIEARRENLKTAEGVRAIIQQVCNDAIQKLLVEASPAFAAARRDRGAARRASPPPDRARAGCVLAVGRAQGCALRDHRLVEAAPAQHVPQVRGSSRPLARVRSGQAQSDIPAERMKMKQPPRVYLARQAVGLLTLLKSMGSEPQAYVLGAQHGRTLGGASPPVS